MTVRHEQDVAALRGFNRVYTMQLGLLDAHLDDSPFTLSEARILYELANRTDPTAAEIAPVLDISDDTAESIVKRRAANGGFKTIEELKKIPGVNAAKLEARKDRIAF